MVEGGAHVIGTFFAVPDCIDTVLITTAPLIVGAAGVGYAVPQTEVRIFWGSPCSAILNNNLARRMVASAR
jgi:riboflavin biosynthesis pyrimidine reductase